MFAQHLKILESKLPKLPSVALESSLSRDIDDLLETQVSGACWGVIADRNTTPVLGERVYQAMQKQGAKAVFFEASPAADDGAVEFVREQSKQCDALVAVGTGTINDICKYASTLDKKPYVVFPTAASMNGYLSANASITIKGYKKTVPGQMPLGVFCDLGIIASAPARLNKSGLGDSMARPTAQADWLLSHLLLSTPYDDTPFTLLKEREPQLFENARGVAKGDPDTIKTLMQVLLLSGLGMTVAGGSYPASQAEHMIAHAYNMHIAHTGGAPATLHGEEIAVTSLAMANRQDALMGVEPIFADRVFPEARIIELFGGHAAQEAKKAYDKKLELMQGRDIGNWESIAEKIMPVMMPPAKMQAILTAAECNTFWGGLGWKQDNYLAVSGAARFLRERFTFLDLI